LNFEAIILAKSSVLGAVMVPPFSLVKRSSNWLNFWDGHFEINHF
jgi:hypothetical protein